MNSGGSFGANPLRQTIGLGTATRIERLEVFWPTSGLTQAFADVPMDGMLEITEGDSQIAFLDLEPLALGAGRGGAAR